MSSPLSLSSARRVVVACCSLAGACASEPPAERATPAAPPRSFSLSSGGASASASDAGGPLPSAENEAAPDPQRERARREFVRLCSPCHGARGEGVVGPNLTDGASIHGAASSEDYRLVIASGVPTRGMPSWERVINDPALLAAIARYVWSLRNTDAPGGKESQGEFRLR